MEEIRRKRAELEREQAALEAHREAAARSQSTVDDTEAAVLGKRPASARLSAADRRFWRKFLVFVALAPVFWLCAATVQRYSGHDYDDARQVYMRAEVRSCERHGPVTLRGGFGIWYSCDVALSGSVTDEIDRPGFFTSDLSGQSIVIGDNGRTSGGSHRWSRPDLPDIFLLDLISFVLALPMIGIAILVFFLGTAVVKAAGAGIKGLFRRR